MNKHDRSSDNWYDGMDCEELSVEPDIYFDEPPIGDVQRYTSQDIYRLLNAMLDLDVDQFKLLQYRLFVPHYSLDKIAKLEGQVKSNIWNRIRALCLRHPQFNVLFKHYDIPEEIDTAKKKEKKSTLKKELDFMTKKKSNLLKEYNQQIKELKRAIENEN